eukprot:CAMPEP_0172009372 /NCGR_PEP_ID=MMETSP1041-20130122/7148_1 /TAXON_ID=464988 /ORGANISM="Hemiselmis andersenii, Strain CCMP439" /LENGTH=87 /DNA_ID=CAMNT_0012663635 /DNA_START=110 /DNA_END=370 /DNA_ORIENTATION=+
MCAGWAMGHTPWVAVACFRVLACKQWARDEHIVVAKAPTDWGRFCLSWVMGCRAHQAQCPRQTPDVPPTPRQPCAVAGMFGCAPMNS